MMFLTIALCASAAIVRNEENSLPEPTITEDKVEDVDSTELESVNLSEDDDDTPVEDKEEEDSGSKNDPWCCCDPKRVRKDEEMICLTDLGYKTLLKVEDAKATTATPGASVLVEDKIVRSCVDKMPQPCAGDECLKQSYVTFSQRERTGKFDREYELPVGKWKAAKYHTKYYSEEAQGRKHVLEAESGNVYAKVDDASKHGLAKGEPKFCTRYETYAYWKFAETDEDDWFFESGYKAMKNTRKPWSCVEKRKCVQYVTVEDACGKKNVVRGDGSDGVDTVNDLTLLGGELYELVGRKGQCEDPEVKEGRKAGAWKWMKDMTGTAGAGSQCPSGMFHSSKGKEASPDIPYRFCDCGGECK